MSWIETESLSFAARHDSEDSAFAERTLDRLENLRLRLEDRFPTVDRRLRLGVEPGQPHRADEVERTGLAAENRRQVGAGLAQREVERRRLEGPAPVVDRHLALRTAACEEVDPAEHLRELIEGELAGEAVRRAGALLGDVVDGVVGDVFAEALVAAAAESDDGGQPFELAEHQFQALERAGLDLERQVGDRVVAGHRHGP